MKCSRLLLVFFAVLLVNTSLFAESVREQMAKAKALFDQGKFRPAADAYKSILVEPKNRDELKENDEMTADLWQAFGEALQKDGWKDQASQAFKRADAHRTRTGKESKGAPLPKNLDKYSIGSLKDPKAQELYRRGAAYIDENQSLFGILELEKALGIEPKNVDLMDFAGRAMAEYGENYFDKAKDLLEKVRKAKTDSLMTLAQWHALGRAATHATKYDFKVAEEALNAALKLDQKNFQTHLYLGDLSLIRGEYKKAVEWFEKAKKINSGDLRPIWGIGDGFTGLKELQNALDCYSDAFEMDKRNAEGAYKFAVGLKNINRIDDSIHFHEVAIVLDPTKAKYHLGLVAIFLPRIMDFSAKTHLDSALALEPENPDCHFYQGLFYEMRRQIGEAVAEYNLAAFYSPKMLEVKYQLANIFAGLGNSFPGNNFSNENPADKLEYLPYKNLKQAYNIYKEILTINPKFQFAEKINSQLAMIEERFDVENRIGKKIEQVVK